MSYELIESEGSKPIKAWVKGVPFEEPARKQLENIAKLPILGPHVAAMSDVHMGIGATVGSVIPTVGAVIPAAVGVDVGCGMVAQQTSLRAEHLPDSLAALRSAIEAAVPHGRTNDGGAGDRGAWSDAPKLVDKTWAELLPGYEKIVAKHAKLGKGNDANHLGTLGTGNHFIEICLDKEGAVWVMLHSGSRGVGNRIGSYFISLAKKDMESVIGSLPDKDLAYFTEGTQHFDDYIEAVGWGQKYARANREVMLANVLSAMWKTLGVFELGATAVNCHHNYVVEEEHFGQKMLITRKGAVRAGKGELGIIPGSMGARSYIVRGKGNEQSFCSCSHGAGRSMSRTAAKKKYTVEDHVKATEGVECRKDEGVLDEIPHAYKSIEAVMAAQSDLVEVVHELRQVVCVKG